MAVDSPGIREVVARVCTRQDVLDACRRRDLGAVITVLCAHGITQGQIAGLTGINQGRLSEYKTHKRMPTATSIFEAFADGLGCLRRRVARSGLLLRRPDPARPTRPEEGQPISRALVRGMCSRCSATCREPVLSRCWRRFERSIVAISRRTG